MIPIQEVKDKLMDVIKKAEPDRLNEQEIINKWCEPNLKHSEKEPLAKKALDSLVDEEKITRVSNEKHDDFVYYANW